MLKLTLTWLALLALLALTVVVSWFPLGWGNVSFNLLIAAAKATLVVLVFMRVAGSPALIRGSVLGALIWLFLLVWLTAGDYLSRGAPPLPGWLP